MCALTAQVEWEGQVIMYFPIEVNKIMYVCFMHAL